jgi:N-acetylneuraminate synthase/sialic acid synthase
MRKMTRDLARIREAFGSPEKNCYPIELPGREKLGKSLYTKLPISKGHVLTEGDLVIKSPGNGIPPSKIKTILGRAARVDLAEETQINPDMLEEIKAKGKRS